MQSLFNMEKATSSQPPIVQKDAFCGEAMRSGVDEAWGKKRGFVTPSLSLLGEGEGYL